MGKLLYNFFLYFHYKCTKIFNIIIILGNIHFIITTRVLEMLVHFFFFFYKMKTKIISNHMSQYFIHNR